MKTLTIESLLVRPQSVELPGGVKVWVRPLSQIERELCQGAARRASRDLRKLLEDPKTEQHQLLVVEELQEYDIKQLRDLWIGSRLIQKALQINRESLENRDETYVPEPEGNDLTPEAMDRYEDEVEEVEQQRETGVAGAIGTASKQLDEEVQGISEDALREQAHPALIEHQLSEVWTREFAAQMLVRATFNDKECRKFTFKTSNEVFMLRPDVLKHLTDSHYGLMVEPEAIKNLAGGQE